MRKLIVPLVAVVLIAFSTCSCKNKEAEEKALAIQSAVLPEGREIYFDSTKVALFFDRHPQLKDFQADVNALYRKHQYRYIWFDAKGIIEVGDFLYNKIISIASEGVSSSVPYRTQLDAVFQDTNSLQKPNTETELLLSSLYFFYAKKVFQGLDAEKSEELGWYLPRKKQSYVNYLDSLLVNPSLMNKDEKEVLGQYYRLKEVLQQYRAIEKKGGWNAIDLDPKFKFYALGDSSATIGQIRKRLVFSGDLATDSGSNVYDEALKEAVLSYKTRNGYAPDAIVTPRHIADLNVPVGRRIQTLMVNMERCRWIPGDITKAKEYIVINIPSYRLTYFKDNAPALISKVVVGKAMNQTVVFSGMMQYIVFSPYWNVPKSIIKKELAPAMAKNKNYLEQHNMEWNGGTIRQKPGPKNSLGLVKFLFPNSNSIYLHDTPSKSLFDEEKRAFSHGCIRVAKPVELANLILQDDSNWTPAKIAAAMNSGTEKWYTLKHKIPVYIGYFTAWVDRAGVVHFYDDVYGRDERLASLIFEK
jgi:murein L,D-transpeptidase YcbB/YkuD